MAVEIPKSLDALPSSSPKWVGTPMKRVEDAALVTGRAEFIDNMTLPGMLHCAMLRSPHAHARIKSIDTSAAEKLPGVMGVVTGEDAKATTAPFASYPEGWGGYCIAVGKVMFVGQIVAAVAATSRYIAEDALELIEVEYEPLPPVMNALEAIKPDSPVINEARGNNIILQKLLTWGDVDTAFKEADQVFTEKFRWHRLGANPMETFGVISQFDPLEYGFTCHGSFQAQGQFALAVAMTMQCYPHKVRLIAHPHGGSFGGKGHGPGLMITCLLSRKLGGPPVKWIEDRMEYLMGGGGQAWDRHYEVSLAVKKDGTMTGLRVKLVDDLGCSSENFGAVGAAKPLAAFTNCYTIPAAQYDVTIAATNKLPTSAYRGMGPPPHFWAFEQVVDIAARGLGMDPAEIRRKNYIQPDQFPYIIPSGNEYDSGDYEACLNKVLEMADYKKLRAEQAEARKQGRYLGIGLVNTIEPGLFDWNNYAMVGLPMIGVPEGAVVSIDIMGNVIAKVGFAWEGQGQYTIITQVLADYFGVPPEQVRVIHLDSLSAPPHFGPGGSRLGVAISGAVLGAAEQIKERMIAVASHLMQTPKEALEFIDGKVQIKGMPEACMTVAQLAGTMLARSDLLPPGMDPKPEATYVWTAPGRTVPDDMGRCKSYLTAANACHLVLVEVDPETGFVKILKYWIADDCGLRLNPANVEGNLQGGVAQGVGAALYEEYVHNEEGQLLTSTFMDYLIPTIYEVPMTEKAALCTPSPVAPLGAKGCGEGAIHTTPAAVFSAINDALVPLGVRTNELPASPNRLWKLISQARKA
jgi:3-oxo-Delta1-steroid hydratase/dehydrogenase large subunit